MKFSHGWWWPDHERHMLEWLDVPKNRRKLNGRWSYQGMKQNLVFEICASGQHRVAIDVGAHVGLWAYNLAHEFATVEAFEPVAAHRECFVKNMEGVGQHVNLHPVALGAKEVMVSMWTEKGSSGNSQVRDEGREVAMGTLDSYGFTDVDLIKVDCEGYETNVLIGAAVTIANCKPVIIVEQKRDMSERFGLPKLSAVDYLKSMGYRVAREISGDYIMVSE